MKANALGARGELDDAVTKDKLRHLFKMGSIIAGVKTWMRC